MPKPEVEARQLIYLCSRAYEVVMEVLRLNYKVEGNGPPLLLVHGFGISFNIWRDMLPFLRPHLTVVMVELPGIGESPLPAPGEAYLRVAINALEGVRLALGFERWNVLGYSTGSRFAEAYVQAYGRHVGRAIFLCPLVVDTLKILGLRFGLWVDRFFPAVGNWILSGWRLKFLIALFGFNLHPDPHADEWYAIISARPVRALKETLKVAARTAGNPFTTSVPCSFIWGDIDIVPITPRRLRPHDHVVHANHAAPVLAAEEVAMSVLAALGE